jgi:hypothetical protein
VQSGVRKQLEMMLFGHIDLAVWNRLETYQGKDLVKISISAEKIKRD